MKNASWLFSLIILFACSSDPLLDGFDSAGWISDPQGCEGIRLGLLDELRERKDEIREWNSEDIDRVLGKPDARDLDRRNRVYYIYNIRGGSACEEDGSHIFLQIRFNSIDRADEITLFE